VVLEVDEVACTDKNGVYGDVNGYKVGITVLVAVHRSDDTFSSTDQKAGRPVDVIRPAGKRFFPYGNNYTWPYGR